MNKVPTIRIRDCNDAPVSPGASYVLYWMIANRRTRWNFALDRAIEIARELGKPLVVLEALRCDYPWACDRFHRFVIDGMRDNRKALAGTGVLYYPYIEPQIGAGKGLLETLSSDACAIVTDEFPCFFLPRMVRAAARRVAVRMEEVDSNGLLPLRAAERVFERAYDFRRFLQRELPSQLDQAPHRAPLRARLPKIKTLPRGILKRWPAASDRLLQPESSLGHLPIDHDVNVVHFSGGSSAAEKVLREFLRNRLPHYAEPRRTVEPSMTSGLSPYLHFGHISTHQILESLGAIEKWIPARISARAGGKREGWWGMSSGAESFLDQLVTWRELGYNFCARRDDYDRYSSLPAWAQTTLEAHGHDERPHLYTMAQFDYAATHDELWNAAQNQLRVDGRIHNYLRMLWGKKILHWTTHPEQALEIMIELNNKYAIDGRNPNSYSGIFWTLGRYDRPWGPEREIFGKVRYMSSANTRRKLELKSYLARWSKE
ncbi:MAG TPA: hypothetical protein VMM84_19175 [Pyrinomonadaceae bacterium]|nr:hypothetical protein [Pyrinomonadaceae bacterium]